jgi:hypothetical protein
MVTGESDSPEYEKVEANNLVELAHQFILLIARLGQHEVDYWLRHRSADDDIPF